MKIIVSLLILNLLIMIHELGHFLAAKVTKIDVLEFSIGMGPKIFSKKIKDTSYSIRLFLIGGFVQLNEDNYSKASWLKQIFVLLSGALFNLLFAIIGSFIYVQLLDIEIGIFQSILASFKIVYNIIFMMCITLIDLFKAPSADALSGPVGIVDGLSTYVEQGFSAATQGFILLNINLFIMNLLPIPILDGGKIVFVFIKKMFNKVNLEKIEYVLDILGLCFLMFVFFLAFKNDIVNIIAK